MIEFRRRKHITRALYAEHGDIDSTRRWISLPAKRRDEKWIFTARRDIPR